jgi:hypothetical protein
MCHQIKDYGNRVLFTNTLAYSSKVEFEDKTNFYNAQPTPVTFWICKINFFLILYNKFNKKCNSDVIVSGDVSKSYFRCEPTRLIK